MILAIPLKTGGFPHIRTYVIGQTFEPARRVQYYTGAGTKRYASNGVVIATNAYFYTSVTNNLGYATNYCLGVPLRAVIAYGDRDAATNDFVYDGRGQMSQLVQYTGTADSNLISQVFYNDRGELVDQVAPNGARVHLAYDQRGSPISRESFDGSALTPLQWEYSYYNENGELTWSDGPRFDPEDYVWREYDGGGRTTEELHWRSRAKADGSGVEPEAGDNLYSTAFRHYDLFGNLVKAIDPNGNYQLMKYDVAGQLTELRSMGIGSGVPLAVESFGYEPGGQVAFFTNSLGGVTTKLYTTTGLLKQQQYPDSTVLRWTYDLNGRVRHEFLSNSNFWDIIYDDANRLVKRTFSADASNSETKVVDRRGNLVITTNAVGAVFTNAYDEFNRIKVSAGPPGLPGFSAQMVSTYSYNDGGRTLTVSNALGERTVTIFDALKRPLTVEVRAADNSLINKTTTVYATNYHSATIVKGTGAGAVTNKAFSDTFGKTVLVQYFPGSGSVDFTLNSYDVAGNLISTRDELNQVTAYAYDALNRLSTNTLPDSAQVVFGYNAAGAITNRLMPGGLTWSATYDSANRMLNEKLTGGAQTARTNTYQYYTGGAFVGRLKTVTDARSVVTTNTYDSLLRLTGVDSSGPQTEHRLHKAVVYDQRGLLTSINHYADDPSILESTTVSRNYDGYGQLVGEEVDISGLAETHFTNQWNSAGRRTQLQRGSAVPAQGQGAGATMGYGYRADGFLTSVTAGSQTYTFSYGDNGLLASRSTPFRTVTVNQRDGRGRLKQLTTAVGVPTPLVETLDWRADSTLDDYTATRSTFTDFRDYSYNVRGQLTNETLAVNAGQTINQAYQFDTDKLGALISAVQTGTRTNRWAGRLDGLKRVDAETNVLNRLAMRATGVAQGVASVDVKLDGTGVGVTLNSANFDGKWFADLDLSAGAHTLLATAHHSLGVFNPSATNTFSVAGTNDITTAYDNAGNVISRTFPGGRVQTFTWDGFGRLLQRAEKAGTTTNWVWRAVYDGLGRRVRTVFTPATNGVPNSQLSTTIDSWYDPLVEFLEVGVEVNGQRTWKVYGPDLSGAYGAMQGIGGAEGAIREIDGVTEGLLNDYFGNAVATISGGQVNWNAGRFDGYGPVQGNQAQPLSASLTVAQSLGWQGRWADLTGDYQMGVRPYSPMLRRFLSCDSLGHVGDWGLYGYARGNPVAIYDPDGRNPLDQISGFTYNKDTGAFTAYHDLPGGTPWVNWHSDGTAILPFLPTWGSTVYPFDYNWQTQELVDRLQHINMAAASFSRIFNPQPLPPPNDAINSGDMDFVYITGALSLTRLGFTVGESTTTAATDALTTSRFTIKQVGNYWVKEVNSQAPSFVQWWARGELDEQAVALEKLGDMAPRFIYENGKLVTRDAGEYVPGNFWQTWLEGTKRLGTPFNDIRPNNIGADGIIFDPAKHPIQQALEAMATAGLLSAGAYEAYNWLTGGNEDSGNGQMLQLNSGPVLSKH